jgi:hypothetical protein
VTAGLRGVAHLALSVGPLAPTAVDAT